MTQDQLNKIDNLYQVRDKLQVKEAKFLGTCGKVRFHDPTAKMSAEADAQLTVLHEKYAKQIKKAKRDAYVVLPSGTPN